MNYRKQRGYFHRKRDTTAGVTAVPVKSAEETEGRRDKKPAPSPTTGERVAGPSVLGGIFLWVVVPWAACPSAGAPCGETVQYALIGFCILAVFVPLYYLVRHFPNPRIEKILHGFVS